MCLSVNKKAVPKKEVLLCGVPKSLKLVLSRDYELVSCFYNKQNYLLLQDLK